MTKHALLALALGLFGCGKDDWHDPNPARTDCGQHGQPCCDGIACYNGGRCLIQGGTAVCQDPQIRDRNECRSNDDCGLNAVCGAWNACAEDRVCFLCEAPYANATRNLGDACDQNEQCRTVNCLGERCTATCRIGPEGDAMCSSMQGGGSFYCGTVEAYYRGSSGPLTTISVCLQRCSESSPCPTGLVCRPLQDSLQQRTVPTCGRALPP